MAYQQRTFLDSTLLFPPMTLVESAAFPHPHQLVEGIERLHCMPTDVPTVPRFVEDTIQVVSRNTSLSCRQH